LGFLTFRFYEPEQPARSLTISDYNNYTEVRNKFQLFAAFFAKRKDRRGGPSGKYFV